MKTWPPPPPGPLTALEGAGRLRPSSANAEVRKLLEELHADSQRRLEEIDRNPTLPWKSWWQVDLSAKGVVTQVWANQLSGGEMTLWTIKKTIDDGGEEVYQLTQHRHVDQLSATVVGTWTLTTDIADEVARTAKGMVKRLRNGPGRTDRVNRPSS